MKNLLLFSGALCLFGLQAGSGPAVFSVYYAVPSWAPDGKTIAFESNRDGEPAVYTIRTDGSALSRLTPPGVPGEQPNWSPDGRHLVFTSNRGGVAQLYLMKLDGTEVTALPNTDNGFLAAFSPDGRWLLFAAQSAPPSLQYRVLVMHPDGSDRRQLGDGTLSNEDPRWSTDGQQVVFKQVPVLERLPDEAPREFIRRREEAARWISIAPDGSDLRELQPEVLDQITRDRGLSPDGRWFVYAQEVGGVMGLYLQDRATGRERLLDQGARAP